MSIKEILQKINPVVEKGIAPTERTGFHAFFHYWVNPFYNLFVILTVAFIFFALGRISALEEAHKPIKIEYKQISQTNSQTGAVIQSGVGFPDVGATNPRGVLGSKDGAVVGSKTGKKYYFPWCGTVKRIKPENQVKFASIEEAKDAGFTPGKNCKGLK
ncbi:MAG: hypothetical protein EXS47_00280 [Candidatus Zambryskibacteria bacterium]|nr:hypothetical protein [Candidatus Zambryskibacteria bacterium]